jgi:hypothetical protein
MPADVTSRRPSTLSGNGTGFSSSPTSTAETRYRVPTGETSSGEGRSEGWSRNVTLTPSRFCRTEILRASKLMAASAISSPTWISSYSIAPNSSPPTTRGQLHAKPKTPTPVPCNGAGSHGILGTTEQHSRRPLCWTSQQGLRSSDGAGHTECAHISDNQAA